MQKKEEAQRRRAERYKKRFLRLKEKIKLMSTPSPNSKVQSICGKTKVPTPVKRKLIFSEILTKHLEEKRKELKTNKKKLNEFSELISPKQLKKNKLVGKAKPFVSYKMYRKAMRRPVKKKPFKSVSNAMIVKAFLEQDINSRICPGKKDTVTRNKVKVQKRVLLDTLKNLHLKFLREHNIKMSYTLFRKLRPFHIVHPKLSDRETCLCIEHANMKLIIDKLYYLKVLPSNSLTKLLKIACCSTKRKSCMYRRCAKCTSTLSVDLDNCDATQSVIYRQWVKKKEERIIKKQSKFVELTTKETFTCPLKELIDIFWQQFYRISVHTFDIHHQFRSMKVLKETMKINEIIVHMDFSENYVAKYASEPQALHFGASKKQLSLHTVVCYNKSFSNQIQSFCTVSSNLDHAAHGVWAHLEPVLKRVMEVNPKIDTIHFLSDGPSSQYKNKSNMYLLLHKLPTLLPNLKQWTWNYSIAGHGKGPMDGIGGTIKRTADSIVLHGQDVTTAKDLIEKVAPLCNKIMLMEVNSADFNKWESYLPPKPPLLAGIQRAHQILWQKTKPLTLEIRSLSCTICKFKFCKHFQLVKGCITFESGKAKVIPNEVQDQYPADQQPLRDNQQLICDNIHTQYTDDAQEKSPDNDHTHLLDEIRPHCPDDVQKNSPNNDHIHLPDEIRSQYPDDVEKNFSNEDHTHLPDEIRPHFPDDVQKNFPDDDHIHLPDKIHPHCPDDVEKNFPNDDHIHLPEEIRLHCPDDVQKNFPDDDHTHLPDEINPHCPDDVEKNFPNDGHIHLPDEIRPHCPDDVQKNFPDDDHTRLPDLIRPQCPDDNESLISDETQLFNPSIGSFVTVIYDSSWYPGIIEEITGEYLHLNFMARNGSYFNWPHKPDRQKVTIESVLCEIKETPKKVSSRNYSFSDEKIAEIDELCEKELL